MRMAAILAIVYASMVFCSARLDAEEPAVEDAASNAEDAASNAEDAASNAEALAFHCYPFFSGMASGDASGVDFDARLGFHAANPELEAVASMRFLSLGSHKAFEVGEIWTEINYKRAGFVKIGYFPETASVATVFPLLNVFQSSLFSDLFRSGGKAPAVSTAFAQFRLALGPFSFKASAAPFEPAWTVIGLDDPFFPRNDIPTELDLGPFLGTYTLYETEILDTGFDADAIRVAPEICLEAAWQNSVFDARLLYFHGFDRNVTLAPTLTLNINPFATYDLDFTPLRTEISVLGANTAVPLKDITLYAETSFRWNSLLLSGERRITGLAATVDAISVNRFSGLAGFLWNLPWGNELFRVRAVGEARVDWNFRKGIPVEAPSMSRIGSLGAEIGLFSERLILSPMFLASLQDGSWACMGKLEWSLRDEFKLWLIGCVFNGKPDSDFGDYSALRVLKAGVAWSI
jgi:hypothetical protein